MPPEARHIQFTNGHAIIMGKNKVETLYKQIWLLNVTTIQ